MASPSSYLASGEYATYGLPGSTPAATVSRASVLVDQALGRPEGLVWTPDASGNPACMAAKESTLTLTIPAGVSPGSNVSVVVAPAVVTPDMTGEVFVLDRAGGLEAVVVTATNGKSGLTFGSVAFSHSPNVTADRGLTIQEERTLPAKRSITRLSRSPLARIVSMMGRYGYGRRSDQASGLYQEMNLLASIQTFGGPPLWLPIDPSSASFSQDTGEVWVPAGQLIAYYSEVKVFYLAGYTIANLPPAVKMAVANIVSALTQLAEVPANVKSFKAGGSAVTRFSATNIDQETMNILAPFKTRIFF